MATQNNNTNVMSSHKTIALKVPKRLVPQLRFKEFDGEWKKNNEKIKILSGNSYPLSLYKEKGILLIQGLNISPGFINKEKPIYIDRDNDNYKHVIVEPNDILIGLNRPIISGQLKVAVFNEKEAFLYQRAGVLKFDSKKIDTHFIYQYLRSYKFLKKLILELVGSDQPYIKSNLFDVTINFFPSLPEQQKIAQFLTAVDSKLQQLNQKKELLEQYKKGAMQQLFSQQIRFKQDNGSDYPNWEEKRLEEIFKVFNGYAFSSKDSVEKGIIWVKIADVGILKMKTDNISFLPNEFLLKHEKFKLIKGDYVMALTRPILDGKLKIARIDDVHNNSLLNQRVGKLIGINENVNDFIFYLLQLDNFVNKIENNIAGSDPPNLSPREINSIKVQIPLKQEQQKIANYLSAIDTKIETVTQQIEATQQFKKGLLQQMFV